MTTKDELLAREETAWTTFVQVAEATPEERRGVEGVVPGWSVHDLLWHCVYWADYAGASLERRKSGESGSDEPPESEVLAAGREISWEVIMQRSAAARERVRAAVSATTEIDDEILGLVASETFDHYDEHAAEIRTFNA